MERKLLFAEAVSQISGGPGVADLATPQSLARARTHVLQQQLMCSFSYIEWYKGEFWHGENSWFLFFR